MQPQIVVEDLVKTYRIAQRAPGLRGSLRGLVARRYRELRALDGVSFSIGAGELVGYIGPNGAGKSTTVKALSGILVPDSGRCEVRGRVPWRQRVEHVGEIGVVFGQRTQLWWDLPVIESFELLRDIYRVPRDRYRAAQRRIDRATLPRTSARRSGAPTEPGPADALRSGGGAAFTSRRCCSWMSRRSGSTRSPSWRCAILFGRRQPRAAASPSFSLPTICTTSRPWRAGHRHRQRKSSLRWNPGRVAVSRLPGALVDRGPVRCR